VVTPHIHFGLAVLAHAAHTELFQGYSILSDSERSFLVFCRLIFPQNRRHLYQSKMDMWRDHLPRLSFEINRLKLKNFVFGK